MQILGESKLSATATTRQADPCKEVRTLRGWHDAMVAALSRLEVPPAPSVYDRRGDKVWWLQDEARYLRAVVAALSPVFDLAAADAADFAGARVEDFAIVEAAAEDFIAPLVRAAEELEDSR